MPGIVYENLHSDDEDYYDNSGLNPGVDNTPYYRFLQNHSTKKKHHIIISFSLTIILTIATISTLVYEKWTGIPIGNEETNNIHLPVILGIMSLSLWAISIIYYRVYKATFGSIDIESNNGGSHPNLIPWEEVAGLPNTSYAYTNLSEIIFTFVFVVGCAWFFISCIISAIKPKSPPPQDPSFFEDVPFAFIFLSFMFLNLAVFLFSAALKRYIIYRRYSHEPLDTGVFMNGHVDSPPQY